MNSHDAPLHPNEMRERWRKERMRRTVSFSHFFTKQLLLFAACAFLIITVDLVLYLGIMFHESRAYLDEGSPLSIMREMDAGLTRAEDGNLTLSADAAAMLQEHDAWLQLVDAQGVVVWSQNTPDDVPSTYALNDIAIAARYSNIADYAAFFWDRDDGLLVMGFPQGAYWIMSLTYPASSVANLPMYALLIFTVDLAILFLMYAVSKRRTQSAVGPIADALDKLSEGRAAEVHLKGDLRDIGEQITEVSQVIEKKDAARASWIRGVSHDIRTPLSMILGYADGIAQDAATPDDVRAHATVIRTQGMKIRDLVRDLNTASQLDYDMQPLNLERVHVARLLRGIVATQVRQRVYRRDDVPSSVR